jgi:hypothetical protein
LLTAAVSRSHFLKTKEASDLKKNVKSAKKDEKTAKNKFKNRTSQLFFREKREKTC